uniref:Rod shape-determining protein MreD n=1 Tax=Caenorhabditis tropicalis TaxID=1561998 RepID=A0A1I7UBD4_9PELO
MFINWAHYLIPKVFFLLSFIFNPIFVYLLSSEKHFQFGDYRFLLYFFAGFNLTASVVDTVVPLKSDFAATLIALRCAFIGGTYGILNSHFTYRFMILRNNHFVARYFLPYGLLASISLVIFHIGSWTAVADYTICVNWISAIAVSTFPVLDPLAIILCLPPLRQRLFPKVGMRRSLTASNQIHSISRIQ